MAKAKAFPAEGGCACGFIRYRMMDTPLFVHCPTCRVAVWSLYAGAGVKAAFVRVGTLDDPNICPPDIHIFTESMQEWVQIPQGARAVPAYYDRELEWSPDSLERRAAMMRDTDEHSGLA